MHISGGRMTFFIVFSILLGTYEIMELIKELFPTCSKIRNKLPSPITSSLIFFLFIDINDNLYNSISFHNLINNSRSEIFLQRWIFLLLGNSDSNWTYSQLFLAPAPSHITFHPDHYSHPSKIITFPSNHWFLSDASSWLSWEQSLWRSSWLWITLSF